MRHPAAPPPVSRPWIATAVVVWVVALGITLLTTPGQIQPGRFEGESRILTDPVDGRYGWWALADTSQGVLLLDLEDGTPKRGDIVRVSGALKGEPGRRGSVAYRATLDVRSLEVVETSSALPLVAGRSLRNAVMTRLQPFDDGRGLLAGFLIGDTSEVDPADVEAMRLSGLSHFVAVSGSNVALFLGLLAFAAGPLAMGPKRRAVVGLLGLPVYAAATRFEPSVMRASVMAALALGGRLVGILFEAWQLLSLAVIALVVFDPGLTLSVGFQLSVAATAGVLVGARWPVEGKIARALSVTAGAQAAVAPLILLHFGSVPLMSPLANLVAAPLVAASTVLGAVGVAGISPAVELGAWLAELVLHIARGAAVWPQLPPWQAVLVSIGGLLMVRWPVLRHVVVVVGAAAVVTAVLAGRPDLPDTGVVVFDVGQGDSILIHGGGERFALVDGGPDPVLLSERLRTYGVTALELVVLTHVHADHATGLAGIVGRLPIAQVWQATGAHESSAAGEFLASARAMGTLVAQPTPGRRYQLGTLRLVVEGPVRPYASPNDESIVLRVDGPGRSMLLSGDIETYAQADLDHLRADVLKVPHQGAGTSDPEWLASVGAELAVISVGPNQYGHPVAWVIETLEASGAEVLRTDQVGDVSVPLG